jgi:hypothetical protein
MRISWDSWFAASSFYFIFFNLFYFFNYIDSLVVLNAHVNLRVWDPAMAGETSP